MTDRELTEAAAKVAGLWDAKNNCIDIPWSPLTNDGDALRLAVKLGLQLDLRNPETHVFGPASGRIDEYHTAGDAFAATRRAIVRAAAAMAG